MVGIDRKENDDWWKFSAQVDKHRQRRNDRVIASHVLVFDESMIAFVPQVVSFFNCFYSSYTHSLFLMFLQDNKIRWIS